MGAEEEYAGTQICADGRRRPIGEPAPEPWPTNPRFDTVFAAPDGENTEPSPTGAPYVGDDYSDYEETP